MGSDLSFHSWRLLERSPLVLALWLLGRDDHGHPPYRYPQYHAMSDMADKLACPELSRVTLGLFAAFMEIARAGLD